MAWPDNLNRVYCSGFDKKHLSVIKQVLDNKKVKWGKQSLFASSACAEFEWAGRTWSLEESFETVTCIALIDKNVAMTDEDFTAAVLKS